MHRVCNIIVLAIASCAGCSSPRGKAPPRSQGAEALRLRSPSLQPDTGTPFASSASTSADSARERYWSFNDTFPKSRADLIARFGPPASEARDTAANRYDSLEVDSLVTLAYPRFSIVYYVFPGRSEFPILLTVTDSSLHLPLPIGIAATPVDLARAFGKPDLETSQGDSVLVQFQVPNHTDCALVFTVVADRVRKVEWAVFPD